MPAVNPEQSHATVIVVDPKDDDDATEILGVSPEELAASFKEETSPVQA